MRICQRQRSPFWRFVTRAGQFDWKQIRFDYIRFDSLLCVTRGWCHLWTVLAKLLTAISLRLAVNAQWRKYESKKKNISLSIFLNFVSWSEELYAVQCEATGRRDHGRIASVFVLLNDSSGVFFNPAVDFYFKLSVTKNAQKVYCTANYVT